MTDTDGAGITVGRPQSVAVVSGFGGSGKTLVTAVAGALVDSLMGPTGQNVFLMDADFLTGGLTELLIRRTAGGSREPGGLAGFALDRKVDLDERPVDGWLQDLRSYDGRVGDLTLLPVIDPAVFRAGDVRGLPEVMARAAKLLRDFAGCLLVDCPSGWGEEARAVCAEVRHIIVVTCPGREARRATVGLIERLRRDGLGEKLAGYIQNTANSTDGSDFGPVPLPLLMSLPYDPHTAEAFHRGMEPSSESLLVAAIRRGIEAIDPVLFQSGFEI